MSLLKNDRHTYCKENEAGPNGIVYHKTAFFGSNILTTTKKWRATVWLLHCVTYFGTWNSSFNSHDRFKPAESGQVDTMTLRGGGGPPATPPFVIIRISSPSTERSAPVAGSGRPWRNLATVIYAQFSLVLDLVRWNWWTEEWHRNDVDNIRFCAFPGRRFKQRAYMNLQFFRPFRDLHIFGGMFHLGSFGTWAFSPNFGLISLCVRKIRLKSPKNMLIFLDWKCSIFRGSLWNRPRFLDPKAFFLSLRISRFSCWQRSLDLLRETRAAGVQGTQITYNASSSFLDRQWWGNENPRYGKNAC